MKNSHSRPKWPTSQSNTRTFNSPYAKNNSVQANSPAVGNNGHDHNSLPAGNSRYEDLGPAINEDNPQLMRGRRNDLDISFHSLRDIDSNIEWASFHSSAGVTDSPNLNAYGYVFESPLTNNVETQAVDPNNNQSEASSSHQDFVYDSDTATAFSGIESIGSIAFDPGTSHTGDLSSYDDIDDVVYSSEPELIDTEPERIDSAFGQTQSSQLEEYFPNPERLSNTDDDYSWKHFHNHLPLHRLHPVYTRIPQTQHPYDSNINFIDNNNGYSLPTPQIPSPTPHRPSPTPQPALEYFAKLATQPCADLTPSSSEDPSAPAYPAHHSLNPPRTLLTSLPPLPPISPSPPHQPPTPPLAQSYIVPASSQLIFSTVTSEIAKANASKRRDHDFGFPKRRRCFGLELAPSRKFVSWQQSVNGWRRRGPDKGPRKRFVKGKEKDADADADADAEGEGRKPVKRARVRGEGLSGVLDG
ncbi:MAG: hypothetical protein L6R42_008574 [Xanthoria sp. 1 TBL-2021]|nr:MAG: hypothetical protein L6R42_008574 [Xanthoria sp. 1 TBL-2021]